MEFIRYFWILVSVFFCLVQVISSAHIPHLKPSERINGGKEAKPHSAPYIAFILTQNSKGGIIQCGGSLISKNYILTAAHCLKGRDNGTVYLGAHNISKYEDFRISIKVDGEGFNVYPVGDLGLIKLPNPVETNENISIVSLPPKSDVSKSYAGQIGTAHGWGLIHNHPDTRTNVLYAVDLEVIPNEECGKFSGEICTSGKNGKGTCNGDSGGPLVVNGTLIGITSNGAAECEKGFPSIFVAVSRYLKWLGDNTDAVIN